MPYDSNTSITARVDITDELLLEVFVEATVKKSILYEKRLLQSGT
jgi:hypothetical protein